jgi:hypothetical protein
MALSFLCGCDYYRTLRVCRRWTALLLRPSSWPMRLPCTFHQVAMASTIAPLLKADDSIAESACNALVALNEQGVDVLLAQNGLKQLTKLMLRDSPSLQLAAINAVFRCGWVRDGAHSSKLVDCGAFARMLQLCSSPDVHVRGRAMVVVGNVLYGAPEQIDVAFKANILPLVLDEIAAGVLQEAFEDPASLLASVAYRANTVQGTVMLQAGALPLLRRYVLNYASDSLRKPPLLRDPLEGKYVMELLKALSNLVAAAATLSEAEQVHGSALSLDSAPHASHAKSVALPTPLLEDERPQVAALLDHWSALVREEAARYLREHKGSNPAAQRGGRANGGADEWGRCRLLQTSMFLPSLGFSCCSRRCSIPPRRDVVRLHSSLFVATVARCPCPLCVESSAFVPPLLAFCCSPVLALCSSRQLPLGVVSVAFARRCREDSGQGRKECGRQPCPPCASSKSTQAKASRRLLLLLTSAS